MHLEVECKRCRTRYRVKDEMAGRMVQCKKCGQRFMVPARPNVVTLGEEDAVEVSEPQAVPPRTFEEYGMDPGGEPAGDGGGAGPSVWQRPLVTLPHELTAVWLPLGLIVLCYGLGLYKAASYALRSGHGMVSGLILTAIMGVVFLWLGIPLVMKALEGAAKTFDFELPNSIRLQTVAACGPAVLGTVLGFLSGGVSGAILGAGIGAGIAVGLFLLLFEAAWVRVLQAGVFASLFLVLGLGISGTVVWGVGRFVMPIWDWHLPWGPAPVLVAEAPKETKVEVVAPTTAPVAEVAAPVVEKPVEVPVAKVEEYKWAPAIDPARATAWRWPLDLQRVLPVSVTASVVRGDGGGPCVAVVDPDGCEVLDVRTGRRVGLVTERFDAATLRLSPGGRYVVSARPAVTRPLTQQQFNTPPAPGQPQVVYPTQGVGGPAVVTLPGSDGLEIWSVETERLVGLIGPSARPVAFVGEDRVVTVADGRSAGRQEVRVWDAPSGQVIREFPTAPGVRHAVSAGGRYLASLGTNRLRVYDLEAGTLTGEAPVPAALGVVYALAFSPDGTGVAALAGETSDAARLLVWNTDTGAPEQDTRVTTPATGSPSDGDLFWAPDGRAMMCGTALVDRATGRTYWTAETPERWNGLTGRLRGLLSNYHAVYEFADPGATKLLYKAVPVGTKRDVDQAIAGVRGENWAAAAEPVAMTAPATVVTPAQVAARREWTITVDFVRRADGAAMDRQIELERARLAEAERTAIERRRFADQLAARSRPAGGVVVQRGPFGTSTVRSAPSNLTPTAADVEADRAEDARRKQNGVVLRLQKEQQALGNSRVLVGRTDDGYTLSVEADIPTLVAAADACEPGTRCSVTGIGRVADGEVRIKARTLAPTTAGGEGITPLGN